MSKPKIAVIIAATRDHRFGPTVAQWIFDIAHKRDDIEVTLVDLKTVDLPFFNEGASNAWMPSQDPKAVAWQKTVGSFDGFIVVTPEYNHSMPASLKNAFDQSYKEWVHKPLACVGYGGLGAARAIEHIRGVAIELQMAPVRAAVHIGGTQFHSIHPHMGKQPIASIEANVLPSVTDMLNDLVWWTNALKVARG